MDDYLSEHIQIYLVRDDVLCLRVVGRFFAACMPDSTAVVVCTRGT